MFLKESLLHTMAFEGLNVVTMTDGPFPGMLFAPMPLNAQSFLNMGDINAGNDKTKYVAKDPVNEAYPTILFAEAATCESVRDARGEYDVAVTFRSGETFRFHEKYGSLSIFVGRILYRNEKAKEDKNNYGQSLIPGYQEGPIEPPIGYVSLGYASILRFFVALLPIFMFIALFFVAMFGGAYFLAHRLGHI